MGNEPHISIAPEVRRAQAAEAAIRRDWYLLTSQLAERLGSAKERDSDFIIDEPSLPYYVRFVRSAEKGTLTCEAVGNDNLEAPYQLSEAQQSLLRNMGWHPPGLGDATRSQNFVRVFYAPSNPSIAASMGMSALRGAFGTSPRRLQWRRC